MYYNPLKENRADLVSVKPWFDGILSKIYWFQNPMRNLEIIV
jgi:hypothetical protein